MKQAKAINEIDANLKSLEDKMYLCMRDKIEISETLNNYTLEISNLNEKLEQIISELVFLMHFFLRLSQILKHRQKVHRFHPQQSMPTP